MKTVYFTLLHRQFPKWRLALPPRDDLEAEFVEEAQRISPAAVQANKCESERLELRNKKLLYLFTRSRITLSR